MSSSFVKLKRIASVTYGLGQPPPLAMDGIRIVRATNIKRGRIDANGLIFARREDLPLNRAPLLRAGEVLVVRSGAYTGDSALVTPEWAGSAPGYDLRVSPSSRLEPRFLAYSLLGQLAVDHMVLSSSRAAQPHLNAEDLGDVPILLTGIRRRRLIADFLDVETAHIDALIAKKRHLTGLLRELRATIGFSAVSGSLGPHSKLTTSSLPWLDERPEHWPEILLRLVARLGSGHTPSRDRPDWWMDCTIPWVTTGEVERLRSDRFEYIEQTREMISEIGLENSSAEMHPAGTVVLCRTASAGYSGILSRPMATSQDFATWTCGPLLRPRFLLLCLRAMRQDLLGRLAMGSTHKTIYMPDIRSIRAPLPPIQEQDRIVELAADQFRIVDRSIDAIDRQVSLLVEHRKALITAAVTGELEVPSRVGGDAAGSE